MIRLINDTAGNVVSREEAEPICGEDFCDGCGDCLVCFNEDHCHSSLDGSHTWVKYEQ